MNRTFKANIELTFNTNVTIQIVNLTPYKQVSC